MGRVSELAMDIEEAEEARERFAVSSLGTRLHRQAVLDRESYEMARLAQALHQRLDVVPECFPLPGIVLDRLRSVRGLVDAILNADERSAGAAA